MITAKKQIKESIKAKAKSVKAKAKQIKNKVKGQKQ